MQLRFLRRLLRYILPVMLLVAQHGALAHLISHVGDEGLAGQDKTLVHVKLCGKCLSAEKLTNVAPSTAATLLSLSGSYFLAPAAIYSCTPGCCVTYRSRAPPHFL